MTAGPGRIAGYEDLIEDAAQELERIESKLHAAQEMERLISLQNLGLQDKPMQLMNVPFQVRDH